MHIISYKKIREFSKKHPKAVNSLKHWYRIVKHEKFETFSDIKSLFPGADIVNNFVIFDVGGNKYRLAAFINYKMKRLFIRHIMTHKEYDKEKWKKDRWFKNM
jgi:mRNA interferase HigB